MNIGFRKRTFTLPSFLHSFVNVLVRSPVTIAALVRPTTSAAMREQIMLGCSSVNNCRYCDWLHTSLALKNGVDVEALNRFISSSDDSLLPKDQAVAVLFAQHFAETQKRPSQEAKGRLKEEFSFGQRVEIMAYLHAIYFGNLGGNTFDAFLLRLKGKKVQGSGVVTELLVLLVGLPILLPITLVARRDRKVKFAKLPSA